MKKYIFLLILLVFVLPARAVELETARDTAFLVNSADSNSAALDVNETSWAAASDWADIGGRANRLKVKFYVYDPCGPNDSTFSYVFYVADHGCNAEPVCSDDVTCGAAQLSHEPTSATTELNGGDPNSLYCWVDTMSDTPTNDWPTGVEAQNNGGVNTIASVLFDAGSAKKAWCRIYDRSSGTMVVYCVAYYY